MNQQQLDKIQDALASLKVDGLGVKRGTIRYTSNSAKVSLTFSLPGEDPDLATLKRFFPDYAGKRITGNGGLTYELCGYKPRSPKFPFIAKRLGDGAVFKFTGPSVHAQLRDKAKV